MAETPRHNTRVPSPLLNEFLPLYRADNNEWWRLWTGDMQNLFDEAVALSNDAELEMYAAIRAALSLLNSFDPTSGTGRTRAFVGDLREILETGLR